MNYEDRLDRLQRHYEDRLDAALARPPVAQNSEVGRAAERILRETDLNQSTSAYDGSLLNFEDDVRAVARAVLASGEREAKLRAAFIKHRTATHEVKPKFCLTCQESDEALAASGTAPAPAATTTSEGEPLAYQRAAGLVCESCSRPEDRESGPSEPWPGARCWLCNTLLGPD